MKYVTCHTHKYARTHTFRVCTISLDCTINLFRRFNASRRSTTHFPATRLGRLQYTQRGSLHFTGRHLIIPLPLPTPPVTAHPLPGGNPSFPARCSGRLSPSLPSTIQCVGAVYRCAGEVAQCGVQCSGPGRETARRHRGSVARSRQRSGGDTAIRHCSNSRDATPVCASRVGFQ